MTKSRKKKVARTHISLILAESTRRESREAVLSKCERGTTGGTTNDERRTTSFELGLGIGAWDLGLFPWELGWGLTTKTRRSPRNKSLFLLVFFVAWWLGPGARGFPGRLPTAELCFPAKYMTPAIIQSYARNSISLPEGAFRSVFQGLLLGPLTILLICLSVSAQIDDTLDRQPDLKSVRQAREKIDDNAALETELKERLLGLYDKAISDLQAAEQSQRQISQYESDRVGIEPQISALQAEVERLSPEEIQEIPETTSAEKAENLLTQELAVLASLRVALRDAEELAEERLTRRTEIARSLGGLGQQLEALSDELRSALQTSPSEELKDAIRTRLLAEREALLRKSDSLRAELELVEARAGLIPWRRDLAELRVARSEEIVLHLETTLSRLRKEEAEKSLKEVSEQTEKISSRLPQLSSVAEETEQYAAMLWGPSGVIAESFKADHALSETRKRISQLERITQLTRRRFEAVGHTGDITQWWPDIPEDFPRSADIRREISLEETRLPNVQHQLIQLEQERAGFRAFERSIRDLARESSEGNKRDLNAADLKLVRDLVHTRRELLDSLTDFYGRYSGNLVELITVLRSLADQQWRIGEFLRERALWVRSVPGLPIPDIHTTLAAALWMLSPENWRPLPGVLLGVLSDRLVWVVGLLLLFGLLLFSRGHIKRRLEVLAGRAGTPEKESFWASAEALVHTLLLAAPFPMVLYFSGRLLVRTNRSPFLVDAGEALLWIAALVALFELARQWLRPNGFAAGHLNWPADVITPIHAGLVWPQLIFLPVLYVALHLGGAGLFLDAPAELQSYNNSLGRIAFVISMAGIGISLVGVLRPRNWKQRINRKVSFYAIPLVMLAFFLPPFLATFGFYLTGILLAYQMFRTIWVGMAVLVIGGLLFRWLDVHLHGQLQRGLISTAGGTTEAPTPSPASKQDQENFRVAEARSRQLVHFILVLLLAGGLFSVWAEAVPALQLLKRIQLWPTVTMMEQTEEGGLSLAGTTSTADTGQAGSGASDSTEGGPPSAPIPLPVGGGATAGNVPETATVLTIWNLLQALLSAFITGVLVKNLPGVLELTLLKRTMLDSGARIAFSTLSRYAIMMLGLVVTFGFLNISWSSVQWLAAALTFGLGFGLQEIVANFVSGIILLVERPVRVGDAVKIGQLQGRVTRTQIRATTISLWDKSEMIVPNKEFITQKLINWTLSDSRRRIEIPLRVAYGTKVEKVKQVLLGVAVAHADVLEEPSPQALLLEFGEDALKFELRAFVDFGIGLKTKDDLLVAIDKAFQEEGIEFALPKLSIEMKNQ